MPEKIQISAKTSVTHPIPIASVEYGKGRGQIIFTMCPGKIQPHADTGPWKRDLSTDLDAIAAAGASALLTLMDEVELQECALTGDEIRRACETRGIAWLHSPITDLKAPDEAWEARWIEIGPVLRDSLGNSDVIAIHCRGGRGRAGMIAARLLVEMGTSPDEAIVAVRAQRPEAIETPEQESHIRSCNKSTTI